MFTPCGTIIQAVKDMIDDSSEETESKIRRHLNRAYYSVCEERNWGTLLKQITLGSSYILPSDVRQLYYVEDDTDYLWFKGGIPERYCSNKLYNYFQDISVATPLLTGTDLVTTINSTTVTSATGGFTSAMMGEYIRVGSTMGVYKIATLNTTNSITLTDAFRTANESNPDTHASLTAQYFEVRPKGTMKLALTDENGDAVTTTTMKIWYSSIPLPLYNDYDEIMLPSTCEALRIKIYQYMNQTDKYTNDSLKLQADYDEAFDRMKALDPIPFRPRVPRNRLGNQIVFGRTSNNRASYDSNGRLRP